MSMVWATLLYCAATLVLVTIAFAYVTRWRQRTLEGLALGGSKRWGPLWPLVTCLAALVRPLPESFPPARSSRIGTLVASISAALGLCFLLANVAVPDGAALLVHRLPGFAHNLLWHVFWFVATLGGFALWGRGMVFPGGLKAMADRQVARGMASLMIALLGLAGAVWITQTLDVRAMATWDLWPWPMAVYQPLGLLITSVALLVGRRRTLIALAPGAPGWPDSFQWQHAGWTFAWLQWTEFALSVWASGLLVAAFGQGVTGPGWFMLKLITVLALMIWWDAAWARQQGERANILWWVAVLALGNSALTALLLWWRQA